LLVGLDGEQKMSKSLGNYVGIDEPAGEQFGKIMSIRDELLPMYFAHATAWPPEKIEETTKALADGSLHPNRAKRLVARTVADLYHGAGAGEAAEAEFDRVHKEHEQPTDMPERTLPDGTTWVDALVATGLADSKRAARRSIEEGAVRCDGTLVTAADVGGAAPAGVHVIQNGKRKWARVTVG
jgi:tyrosyl-tRNA synthetase